MTRILVVDDSAVDRRLASGLLENIPHVEIEFAENGLEALEQMKIREPDLVLTDLQMPKFDGLKLVQAIGLHHSSVPVVLMTRQGSEEIAIEALKQGAASYVTKSQLADRPELRTKVLAAAADSDPRVRYRVALVLGGLAGDDVVGPLVAIALAPPADRWTRAAVTTAQPSHIGPMLNALLRSRKVTSQRHNAPELTLVHELATIVGASRRQADVAAAVLLVTDETLPSTAPVREAALRGLAQGLARRGAALSTQDTRTSGAGLRSSSAGLTGMGGGSGSVPGAGCGHSQSVQRRGEAAA